MRIFLALLVAACCSGCGGCVHESSGSGGGASSSPPAGPLVPGVAIGQGPRVMRINPALLGGRPDAAAAAPSGSAAPTGAQE